ncbi:MAG: glutathione S-transferase N-terminal domain-containing protein, partial [Solirubrobacterales bacterium]
MPRATLYTIPGSHPGISAALMLERKGVEYRRVDLLPVISKVVLRALGFPLVTVPALKLDGRKFQGSIE